MIPLGLGGGSQPVTTFELEAALGRIEGVTTTNKYGRAIDVDTTDSFPVDVWNGGGVYTGFPTGAAETMEISSSDVNDTATGTGARTVTISNLRDGDGNAMDDVTVTLNGTGWVSLGVQTYSRASRIRVQTVGSAGHNVGQLTLRHTTTTTNIFAVMPAQRNSTMIMAYTVPVGKKLVVPRGFISISRASGAAGSINATIRAREYGTDKPFVALRDLDITTANPYIFENNGFFVFEARTDLKVSIESVSDNDTNVASEYDGYLIDV